MYTNNKKEHIPSFPTTRWNEIKQLNDNDGNKSEPLNTLLKKYRLPLYYFILSRGYERNHAEDLVQDFLIKSIEKKLFERATHERGRLRSFLLTSLKNFLSNAYRNSRTKERYPQAGIVSINESEYEDKLLNRLIDKETPEIVFYKTWFFSLIMRVVEELKQEYEIPGKRVHYEIFRRRIIEPIFEGKTPQPMSVLANKYDISEKQANNLLLTVKRSYRRLLREEIRHYCSSEKDVTIELNEIFYFLDEIKSPA